ncbi:hypothetical protein JHK82_036601 [Glycine max]|nr:hypothetical protein JHK85_037334 [Glycine max]KAG4977308.1 hypothetical protein JHK86_036782 [Glycine max]KAG5113332.1 hypothetical protein JHK82_036601 [Glycine max]KAG5130612.1 hypothetical protein JHK84_037009 [Glycine max]
MNGVWEAMLVLVCTQQSWKHPYGVGHLVAGLDESGAHLYYNCPSGNYFEYQAFAIGSRSQAAKTYLERKSAVCTIAVVGVGEPFHILDQETVQQLIDTFEIVREEEAAPAEEEAQPAAEQDAPTDQGAAAVDQGGSPMDI